MGYSRQQFYEIRRNFQTYGAEGLIDRLPGFGGGLAVGKAPTTRVRRLISRIRRSSGLLVRMRRQCSSGKA